MAIIQAGGTVTTDNGKRPNFLSSLGEALAAGAGTYMQFQDQKIKQQQAQADQDLRQRQIAAMEAEQRRKDAEAGRERDALAALFPGMFSGGAQGGTEQQGLNLGGDISVGGQPQGYAADFESLPPAQQAVAWKLAGLPGSPPSPDATSPIGKPSPRDYTPASLARYAKTKNYADLVPVESSKDGVNLSFDPESGSFNFSTGGATSTTIPDKTMLPEQKEAVKRITAGRKAIGTIDMVMGKIKDGTPLGFVGAAKRMLQGAGAQTVSAAKEFGIDIDAKSAELLKKRLNGAMSSTDPRMAELSAMTEILAFQIASAREGGKLTDSDISRAKETFGAGRLLTGEGDMIAALKVARDSLNSSMLIDAELLGGEKAKGSIPPDRMKGLENIFAE